MLFLQTLSLAAFLYVALAMTPFTSIVAADGLENLKPERLEAVRRSVATYRTQRTAIPQTGPFQEHRANLHVHSHWSHDSVGTVDEIVAAARATGTSVLMFSEHPADHYDFYVDGNQGVKDGVLMIPGAEMQGVLAYPKMSLRGVTPGTPQDLSDLIRGRDGQIFVSHLEERMDWRIQGVTGVWKSTTRTPISKMKRIWCRL